MNQRTLWTGLGAVALAAAFAMPSAANAEKVKFHADLTASKEVPSNTGKGTGVFTATYDTATKKLTYSGTYSGLTGKATAAHFHGPAEPGKNAGVAVPISDLSSPIEGSATLTDQQAKNLMAGKWYVNVHTAAHPKGEIRGQLTKGS